MGQRLDSSIVRIQTPKSDIAGAGFLVGEQRVLTCAHVVAAALGIPEDTREAPADEVLLDFPFIGAERALTARVIH